MQYKVNVNSSCCAKQIITMCVVTRPVCSWMTISLTKIVYIHVEVDFLCLFDAYLEKYKNCKIAMLCLCQPFGPSLIETHSHELSLLFHSVRYTVKDCEITTRLHKKTVHPTKLFSFVFSHKLVIKRALLPRKFQKRLNQEFRLDFFCTTCNIENWNLSKLIYMKNNKKHISQPSLIW
jgi:hypothetical protein